MKFSRLYKKEYLNGSASSGFLSSWKKTTLIITFPPKTTFTKILEILKLIPEFLKYFKYHV